MFAPVILCLCGFLNYFNEYASWRIENVSSLSRHLNPVCLEISILCLVAELALMVSCLLFESGLVLVSRDRVELKRGLGS